jgi:hypothetical protein
MGAEQWWRFETSDMHRMEEAEAEAEHETGEAGGMHAVVPHADGGGDRVAYSDAHQVNVLRQRAQPVLGDP